MRKGTSKNKKQISDNQKISSFFTKIVNGSANKKATISKSEVSKRPPLNQNTAEVICLEDSDEDFIERTPTSKHVKSICSTSTNKTISYLSREHVLEPITNLPKCSKTPDYIQQTPESKKRKHPRENTPSPDYIPCSLNPKERAKLRKFNSLQFPPKKKAVRENNEIQVENLTNLPKEDLDQLQSPSKNNRDVKPHSPIRLRCKPAEELMDNNLCLSPLSNHRRSLELLSNGNGVFESPIALSGCKTPEKLVIGNKSRSTPKSSNKKSPAKLFNKSPKSLHKFNVEVIEKFVTVTPSKHNTNRNEVSNSYASPSVSARSIEIQEQNESTPIKSPQTGHTIPQYSKVKTKLNFSTDELLMQSNNIIKTEDKEEINCLPNDISHMLNDSWDGDLIIEDKAEHKLDLNQSQHCKIVELEQNSRNISLTVQSTKDKTTAQCIVEGFWLDTKLALNDTLHITAVYDVAKSKWCISNDYGLIVFEPNFLVSTTSLVGTLFCMRRSILSEKYRGFEPSNRIMVVGILVHSLLQNVLRNNVVKFSEIEVCVKKMLLQKDTMWMCYESELNTDDIQNELMEFVPRIVSFMQQYVRQPGKGSIVQKLNKDDWNGKIDSIQDIEENIWCPELGVKGKVDVSIKSAGITMPLELKTGRATVSLEHRGQVILYVMMMNKFGYTIPSGLLLYLREGVLREIPVSNKEKRDIIILRNELTYYLTRKPKNCSTEVEIYKNPLNNLEETALPSLFHSELPKPINHHNGCSKCPYNVICCTYLQFENNDLTNNPLMNMQKEVLAHLEPAHLNYFIKWSTLLGLEQSCTGSNKQLHEIYTMPPEKREKKGQCIIGVRIKETVLECGSLFKHTFEKISIDNKPINLLSSGIVVGNYVVVSIDTRPAVGAGFVTQMDHQTITISLDRDLNKRYSNRSFYLDTYNSSVSQTFNMTNLALLLEASEQADKLRKIVIDKRLPTFQSKLPKAVAIKGTPILRTLNKTQQKAILKALSVDDYLLIKGMPGTGKTATIVSLVQLLVELNKTVLITSHTHSAVDNVCTRLQAVGVNVLRLGAESKINPKLHSCSEHTLTKHCVTPQQLEEVYNGANVLAVTCLGSGHPVLSKRQVDVCIIDESTQVLQCSVFRALYAARKFILIGDPDQLPPVVQNREAVARGLAESLFERLDSPTATVLLSLNYRMNKSITAMANALTYEGQLLIANDTIANATLSLPLKEEFLAAYEQYPWITQVLDQSLESSIKILDTGSVWNRPSLLPIHNFDGYVPRDDEASKCSNPYETAIVVKLVNALLEAGVPSHTIGVIASYRAQVSQISLALKKQKVEVSTVDQFQGRDKDVVFYSCTKSSRAVKSRSATEFEILEDQRRLTVAITRAKHKFILIGDLVTVRQYSPFAKLLTCLDESCFLKLQDNQLGFSWDDLSI